MGEAAILGIDQGTTGTRACILGAEGGVLATSYRAHRQHYSVGGSAGVTAGACVEHDAEEIGANVVEVVREAIARAAMSGGFRAIAAVALANQGETVLAWDRRTGVPIGRAIVWQDLRTQAESDALAARPGAAALVRARTGLRIDPYFCATKLRWLLDHVPAVAQCAREGALALSTLDAWILHRLTGGATFATDASTAARTLVFDIHTCAWDDALCALFGLSQSHFPEVRRSCGPFGEVRGVDPRVDGAPILASLVDQPAALFGQGCLERGQAKATFGTGCFVTMNAGAELSRVPDGLLGTLAWQRAEGRSYALDGGVFAAGSVVTWLRDALGFADSDAGVDALAASVKDGGGVVCVPAFAGLGAPHWDREARAAWLGVGLAATKAHLAYAAFEGIACRVAEVVRAMASGAPTPLEALRVDGGLTASATLMQLVADVSGLPVHVSAETEATVLGAIYFAARAAGVWTSDDEIERRVRTARTFEPRTSAGERGERAD